MGNKRIRRRVLPGTIKRRLIKRAQHMVECRNDKKEGNPARNQEKENVDPNIHAEETTDESYKALIVGRRDDGDPNFDVEVLTEQTNTALIVGRTANDDPNFDIKETTDEPIEALIVGRRDNDDLNLEMSTEDPNKFSNVGQTDNDDNNFDIEVASEEQEEFSVAGRRLVDINFFIKKIKDISDHGKKFGCSFSNLQVVSERREGFNSSFRCICNMCNSTFMLPTNDKCDHDKLDINTSAVAGVMAVGAGFSQLQELFAMLDVPVFTEKTYNKIHSEVIERWEESAIHCMTEAAARERDAAIEQGRFSSDGIPVIDVIADGTWGKRSYKTKYSSLSGAAAIVGRKFGEVIYLGVRNKFCAFCSYHTNLKKTDIPEHVCFKNFDGPSTGMETEILVEGFRKSVEMYGLIYGRLISDGDASTYSKILQARPYSNVTVEKIECRNHLMRNICSKLQALSSDKKYPVKLRKCITTSRILEIRKVVKTTVKLLNTLDVSLSEKIQRLHSNITNSVRHAFGDHNQCEIQYCSADGSDQNTVKILEGTTLWLQMSLYMSSLAAHSRSLINDVDSNKVEQFHSIIAKVIGGKRVNYSSRGSYQGRCNAAVVSHNTRTPLTTLSKSILGHTPTSRISKLEKQRSKRTLRKQSSKRKIRRKLVFGGTKDRNYGCAEKPDLPEEEFVKCKSNFLTELKNNALHRNEIERQTVHQSDSGEWLELRRKLLTASHFGKVCKRRLRSGTANLVKSIVTPRNLSNVSAISHGKKFEKIALQQLSVQESVEIKSCGIFIDSDLPYIGASPDGITDDMVVEVKCPITSFKLGFDEAFKRKKINFWRLTNGIRRINTNHDWYYQIQGQMHITGKSRCLFGVWSGHDERMVVEYIDRDDKFWEEKMVTQLTSFYMDSLLPEIVDSRLSRSLQIREPHQPEQRQLNATKRNHTGKKSKLDTKNKSELATPMEQSNPSTSTSLIQMEQSMPSTSTSLPCEVFQSEEVENITTEKFLSFEDF